jgi:hypothetical protein
VRKNPKFTYKELQRETGLDFSRETFRSILRSIGIENWRSKRRPALTEEVARLRLQFAVANLDLDWTRVIFSDECSVEKGVGKQRTWSFGYPHEKWGYDKVDEYSKGKQASIMIWGAICLSFGRSELIIMERDPISPKGGYSSISYTNALSEGLLPIYNGETFMQDNAPVHTSRHSINWLGTEGVYVLPNWPPYSPDLNPIEHLWPRLKEKVYQLHLYILDITNKEAQQDALTEHLPEAWESIALDVVQGCLNSMRNRLQACIDASGWHTRY